VIERATRQPIEPMQLPTIADVNERRVERFNARIAETLASGEGDAFRSLVAQYEQDHNVPALEIAAALASIAQGKKPLLLDAEPEVRAPKRADRDTGAPPESFSKGRSRDRQPERDERANRKPERKERSDQRLAPRQRTEGSEEGMETFRIEVGHVHGVKPANIVGAIANEAGLEGQHIGRVIIREDHSFVDLPEGMPKDTFIDLQKVRVAGQKLQISRALKSQVEQLRNESSGRGKRPVAKGERRKRS
jgi:ATP-dependent RNA helicase DeaD